MILYLLFLISLGQADTAPNANPAAPPAVLDPAAAAPSTPPQNDGFGTQAILGQQEAGAQRSDSLSFDDELIEGMNQNPFESLTNLGKKNDIDQGHLYHRKPNFKKEIRRTSQEMGYVQ